MPTLETIGDAWLQAAAFEREWLRLLCSPNLRPSGLTDSEVEAAIKLHTATAVDCEQRAQIAFGVGVPL